MRIGFEAVASKVQHLVAACSEADHRDLACLPAVLGLAHRGCLREQKVGNLSLVEEERYLVCLEERQAVKVSNPVRVHNDLVDELRLVVARRVRLLGQ